jgi:hypothetical protein
LYLDAQLASVGGSDIAGTTVGGQVIANFSVYNGSSPNVNYAPVNIGQLKSVAQHFYDRLNVVGYNVTADLEAHGYPAPSGGNYTYPWPTPPPALGQTGYNATVYNAWAQGEYAPANLGQLKAVFDFDLTNFTPSPLDANGIRSSWEIAVYGNLTTLNSSNWLTEDITSGNTSIPDYKNASVTSPAILTVTITYPANGTAFN